MREYKPNPRIVARAAEIWVRLLRSPQYDNGETNPERNAMAQMLVRGIPSNATDEVLEKFRMALIEKLTTPKESGYIENSLRVDYGPDGTLADAANKAGLKMEWPWKTGMWLDTDHLSVEAGYSAESVYHYPLTDDRWLVTRLTGSEISKVIDYVNGGKPEFLIESPQASTGF